MFVKFSEVVKRVNHLSIPHKAIVLDNIDSLKLGRVKVSISGLIEETDTTKLPWVYPRNNYGLGGKSDSSSFSVPEIGSELVVQFPFDDIYSGFYVGYWQSSTTHQTDFDVDYPETYGHRDSKGNIVKVNKSTGDVEIKHFSGTKIIVKNNGDIELIAIGQVTNTISGNQVESIGGNLTETVSGNSDETITGKKTITGNLVEVDGMGGNGMLAGIVQGNCVCALTGAPHPQISFTVKASI